MAITARPSWDFQPDQARSALFGQFGTTTLNGFGISDDAIEVTAAGALWALRCPVRAEAIAVTTRVTRMAAKRTATKRFIVGSLVDGKNMPAVCARAAAVSFAAVTLEVSPP